MVRRLLPREHGIFRLALAMAVDCIIVVGGYTVALMLRFDGNVPPETRDTFRLVAPLIALAYLVAYVLFGIYRTAWRYGGAGDVVNLAKAVFLVTAALFFANFTREVRDIPLSVNLIGGALIFLASGFVKMTPRLFANRAWSAKAVGVKRLLIVGAGSTGQFVAREFRAHPQWLHRPVCFVDDDRRKFGMRVHGVPVAGTIDDIPELVQRYHVNIVALAIPSASGAKTREIVTVCHSANVPVRTVPGLPETVQHPSRMAQWRELTVEDLIGREPVEIDHSECLGSLRNRVVLITGAAGSIGSELARQVMSFGPAALHILDNNETGLHEL